MVLHNMQAAARIQCLALQPNLGEVQKDNGEWKSSQGAEYQAVYLVILFV